MGSAFSSKKLDPSKDLLDLKDRVVIVTGGSSGIGLSTARLLASRGAKVYIGARSPAKARAAIAAATEVGQASGGSLHFLELDLSHPRLAREGAARFIQLESRLDVLVNNAAMLGGPFKTTEEGYKDIVVTNVISLFVFTECLLPLLKATAEEPGSDTRIVNLSSVAHKHSGPIESFKGKQSLKKHYNDNRSGGVGQYAFTKVAVMLQTKELQRRCIEEGVPITCISIHPGEVDTQGFTSFIKSLSFGWAFLKIARVFMMNEADGGLTPAFAAAGKRVEEDREKYQGAYLLPYDIISKPAPLAKDDRLARELWDTLEEVAKEMI